MPELGPYGSVRGALSNERPYRDSMRVLRILTQAVFGSIHRTCLSPLVTDRAMEAWYDPCIAARKPVPLVNPEQRLAEWWIVTFTDEAWSFSTMVAAKFGFEVIESVTKDLGLKTDSREANKVAWFVLSRVGDFKIYDVYQKAGFSREAATQFVRSVLENPSPYEVYKH
jgi:hypothetical protein